MAAIITASGVFNGTSGADILTGTNGSDTLNGLAGDDVLTGLVGADVLDGGAGVDTADYSDKTAAVVVALSGSTNATVTAGSTAEDTIRNIENIAGGSGNDTLTGDSLANTLTGGEGDDVLKGLAGADVLDGGAGVDTADYSDKTVDVVVTLNGTTNANVEVGGIAEDTIRNIENLIGGSGNDTLTGDSLANTLTGGAGDDVLKGLAGADVLDGGAGVDTADYSDKTVAVVITLNGSTNATVTVGGTVEGTIRNVENLIGGLGNDTLTGDDRANTLTGGAGDDIMHGGTGLLNGADVLDGGAGVDTADYSHEFEVVVTLNGSTNASVTVGGTTEDTIRNIESVIGGWGNDTLTGDTLANTLTGGSGDDVLKGLAGADILDGGADVDTADYSDKTAAVVVALSGSTNATVTVGGTAEDTIRNIESLIGGSGADTLTGDTLANRLTGGSGDDLLKGLAGSDILDGGAGVDTADYSDKTTAVVATLNGTTTATVRVGGAAEDTIRNVESLIGGSGADTLTGDSLANALTGGTGNDTLTGSTGSDTYVYNAGDGLDTIVEAAGASDTDKLVLGAGILPAELIVTRSSTDTKDAVLTFTNRAGSITLDEQFSTATGSLGVEQIVFANGTTWDRAAILAAVTSVSSVINGTSGADTLTGTSGADTINGLDGDDTINGLDGDDTLKGLAGADVLDGGAGVDTADYSEKTAAVVVSLNGSTNATVTVGGTAEDTIRNIENLVGGSGNDKLTGDSLANTLWGEDGDDTLKGLSNSDRYVYDVGGGADTIVEGAGGSDIDRLVLGADLVVSNLIVARSTSDLDDVTLSFAGTGGSITLDEQFYTSGNGYGIEQIVFGDGAIWSKVDLQTAYITQTQTNGNDTVNGFDGSTTFSYLALAGTDTIKEGTGSSDVDRLVLGADLVASNLIVARSTSDLDDVTLSFAGTGGSITLDKQFYTSGNGYGIEQIVFGDGAIWSKVNLQTAYITQSQTNGNDTVNGFNGSTTFSYMALAGTDTIKEGTGGSDIDRLVLGGDLVASNLIVARSTSDLDDVTLSFARTGGSITLDEQFYTSGNGYGIEQIVFGDGAIWSKVDLQTAYITQTQTNGNDIVNGFDGSTTFSYMALAGTDTIKEGTGSSDIDRLVLRGNLVASNLIVARSTSDLDDVTLSFAGTGGSITLDEQFYTSGNGYGIEQIVFGDGVVWGKVDLQTAYLIQNQTNGDDTIYGFEGIVDYLSGGLGNDIYIIDEVGDVVTEVTNEGIDTVQSAVAYILGANVENLTLSGTSAINGTGNTLANVLIGNSRNNRLDGDAGADTLDGGGGADTLVGGLGDDIYIVDNTGDVVTEVADEGIDTVQSGIAYILGAGVENLTLTGTAAINGTGNTLANILIGNAGNNTLNGGAAPTRCRAAWATTSTLSTKQPTW